MNTVNDNRWRRGQAHPHRNTVFFDDISDAVPVCSNWSKAKQTKSGVTAVGSGKDRSVQDRPAMVGEDRG